MSDEKGKMFGFEPPVVERPTKATFFGKPKAPVAICSVCKKESQIVDMQKYYNTPTEVYWLCPKCVWKRKIKETFSGKI